jgi:hypothetical protein
VQRKSLAFLRFTEPKVEGQYNEDSFETSMLKGIVALSDGASVSFDSASWSRILVRRYVQHPNFSPTWLSAAIAKFRGQYDREALPWMQQAAFDKGSFASLLGVRIFDRGARIQVLAIGDSLAVLSDGDKIKTTFPYTAAPQFKQRPQLLCTNPAENAFINGPAFDSDCFADWTFRGLAQPTLLCMTDALGHWLLSWKDPKQSAISIITRLRTPNEFSSFVRRERASGRMKRDDTTLLMIW